jgi:hypothetical protein
MKLHTQKTILSLRIGTLVAAMLAPVGAAHAVDRVDADYTPDQLRRDPFAADEEGQDILDRVNEQNLRFGGPLDKDFFDRTLAAILSQQLANPLLIPGANAPITVARWKSIGPTANQVNQNDISLAKVISGRLRSILPHPTDPNTLYVLSAGGGMWKTSNLNDAFPNWKPLTDATVTTSGGAAAMGSNPDTLYLGLGDPFDGLALLGGYMLRSTNGGSTWSAPISLPTASLVTDVKVDSSGGADVVLAGTNGGLYRSIDGGVTYSVAAGIPTTRAVASLAKTSAGWLAATFVSDTCCRFGLGASATIYRSTDGGATWAATAGTPADTARFTLAVGQPGDAVVFAVANQNRTYSGTTLVNSGTQQKDVWRSTDGGLTWASLAMTPGGRAPTNPNPEQGDLNFLHSQGWYNQMLVVDPSDATRNTVYIGGNLATGKSTDGGATWKVVTNWLAQFGLPYTHADHHTAAFTTTGGSTRVFYGNDGGLFYSDDGGTTFSDRKNIGLVNHLMYSLAVSGTDPSSVVSGLQDNGTLLRVNGTTVYNGTFGGDGFGTGWSQAGSPVAMGSYVYNYVYFTNPGVSPTDQSLWQNPTEYIPDPTCGTLGGDNYNGLDSCYAYFVTSIATPTSAADPTGKVFFARTAYELYKTADGGNSWNSLSLTDGNIFADNIRSAWHVIGVHPKNVNRVAAATTGRRVRVTTNGGASWVHRTIPSTLTGGFNSTVAWANDTTFYVGSENAGTQPNNCFVHKTTDLGVTFARACAGLPAVPIQKILVSPADPTGLTAYAATWIGVYRTTNGGASWSQFGAGLPVVKVSDLYMPAKGGFLRIATYGRGIWEIPTAR